MIFREVTPNKQMALRGWSGRTESQVITIPTEKTVVEFCTCNFFCDYYERVYADVNDDSNSYKNDFKSFLTSPKDVTSTVVFTLVTPKNGDFILEDNTFGEYFAQGFNTEQPLQVGIRVDWVKVLPVFGEGDYKIKISQTDFGNTVEVTSHVFKLENWAELRSNNTVKIEYNQKGKILNGENYSGITWKNMLRLHGKFGNHKPQYEINRLQDSNYQDLDVQTLKFNTYQLQTDLIPSEVGKTITDNLVLTDEIFISVNDVFNYEQYRDLKVVFEGSLENSDDYARNNMKSFQITFKDKFSKLKRNFK